MAANMLRKFGFKKSEPRESEARLKLQKELFAFNTCVEHGFPHKPTAMAYDTKLKIMAIGTKSGELRVYGKPGVEFSAQHPEEEAINRIFFLNAQARLITVCSNNTVYLWEINAKEGGPSVLEQVRSFSMEASKLKTISACCVTSCSEQLLIGTEGGNIHMLDTNTFKLSEQIIYQDVVMQNVPDDFKVNPGAVEAVCQSPTDPSKFLIGYNRGLIVLWDNKESNAEQTYNASQGPGSAQRQLEALSWNRNGKEFMSAHADGSYIVWLTNDSSKPKDLAQTPYGPYPCKAITNISWKAAKADSFVIFAGGMPRSTYGEKNTVTVQQGVQHVVFDFTSRVIDFVPLCTADEVSDIENLEYDDPHSLLVLAEEELVVIDLQSEGWQPFRPPYLHSLHSSAITAVSHVPNVPEALWNKMVDVGDAQLQNSSREWPIGGGQIQQQNEGIRELLLTGHEDGSVRFWDASSSNVTLLYKYSSAPVFVTDAASPDAEEEEWPPFKKVGTFDPYSDDPRLAIQKLKLCPLSETLVIGGTAGQIIVLAFEREQREQEIKVVPVNVISDRDNYSWKGHQALSVHEGDVKFSAGFQPASIMQLAPPAAITALELQSEWQLVGSGTAHGYAIFDYAQKKEVFTKCTLSPQDLSGTSESQMSRHKSFKKSLRESFRRLRTRRSQRAQQAQQKRATAAAAKKEAEGAKKTEEEAKKEDKPAEAAAAGEGDAAAAAPATEGAAAEGASAAAAAEPAAAAAVETTPTKKAAAPPTSIEEDLDSPRPVERQVESRTQVKDEVASMVRTIYFADTFLTNAQNHGPVLFAGTNHGTIFAHELVVPAADKRETEDVTCTLRKELQLQHRAPVVSVFVLDRHAQPLPAPLEVTNGRAKPADYEHGNHQLVVVSEEQFKIFSLPNLKAVTKYKLTAHEGCKVRKVALVGFRSRSDERYLENDLAVLTNVGDVHVFSVPNLRRQIKAQCVKKENVNGIACSIFTASGEGFFLRSPSEFERFSVSARFVNKPACAVEIAEGVRPPPPEPEVEPEQAAAEEVPVAAAAEAAEEGAAGGEAATAAEGADAAAGEEAAATPAATADDSTVGNDSLALDSTVDSANMTVDSVRFHNISESKSSEHTESGTVIESSRVITSSTRVVTTRVVTTESSASGDGPPVTSRTETVTVQQSSSDSGTPAVEGAAAIEPAAGVRRGNLDDDTKLTGNQITEVVAVSGGVMATGLADLHITEDGDSPPPPAITITPASPPPVVEEIVEQKENVTQSAPPVVDDFIEETRENIVESAPQVVEIIEAKKEDLVDSAPVVEEIIKEKKEDLAESAPVVETMEQQLESFLESEPVVKKIEEKREEFVESAPPVTVELNKDLTELQQSEPLVEKTEDINQESAPPASNEEDLTIENEYVSNDEVLSEEDEVKETSSSPRVNVTEQVAAPYIIPAQATLIEAPQPPQPPPQQDVEVDVEAPTAVGVISQEELLAAESSVSEVPPQVIPVFVQSVQQVCAEIPPEVPAPEVPALEEIPPEQQVCPEIPPEVPAPDVPALEEISPQQQVCPEIPPEPQVCPEIPPVVLSPEEINPRTVCETPPEPQVCPELPQLILAPEEINPQVCCEIPPEVPALEEIPPEQQVCTEIPVPIEGQSVPEVPAAEDLPPVVPELAICPPDTAPEDKLTEVAPELAICPPDMSQDEVQSEQEVPPMEVAPELAICPPDMSQVEVQSEQEIPSELPVEVAVCPEAIPAEGPTPQVCPEIVPEVPVSNDSDSNMMIMIQGGEVACPNVADPEIVSTENTSEVAPPQTSEQESVVLVNSAAVDGEFDEAAAAVVAEGVVNTAVGDAVKQMQAEEAEKEGDVVVEEQNDDLVQESNEQAAEIEPPAPADEQQAPASEQSEPTLSEEAPSSEPQAPSEEPQAPSSEPQAPSSEPQAPSSEPQEPSSEPQAPSEEPQAPSSEPQASSEEPQAPSSEPQEPSSEPQAPSEEPQAPSEEPQAPSEEPQAPSSEPQVPSEEPQALSEEPQAPSEEPQAPSSEPQEPSSEPHAQSEEPQAPSSEQNDGAVVNGTTEESAAAPTAPEAQNPQCTSVAPEGEAGAEQQAPGAPANNDSLGDMSAAANPIS